MDFIKIIGFIFFHAIILYALINRGKSLMRHIRAYSNDKDSRSLAVEVIIFIIVLMVIYLLFHYFLYDTFYKDML